MYTALVRSFVFVGTALLCHSACHHTAQPAGTSLRVEANADAGTYPSDASGGAMSVTPRSETMETMLEEIFKFRKEAGTYRTLPAQTPSPNFRALPSLGPFPKAAAARAVMVTYSEPCERMPLTEKGTLCGSVYAPDKDLTPSELADVLKVIPVDPPPGASGHHGVASTRCDFEPHHALVFYNDHNVAIGTVLVCFTCGEWLVTPGSKLSGSGRPVVMPGEAPGVLRRIATDHGLAPWRFGDADEKLRSQLFEYLRARYGSEEHPTPEGIARRAKRLAPGSGVSKEKKLNALSKEERLKLCHWTENEARPERGRRAHHVSYGDALEGFRSEPRPESTTVFTPADRSGNGEAHGYECPDGTQWSHYESDGRCMDRPLACDKTVAQLEACLAAFREPEDLCATERDRPAECQGLRACIPFLEQRTARP